MAQQSGWEFTPSVPTKGAGDASVPTDAKSAEVRRGPRIRLQSLHPGTQSLQPTRLQVEPNRRSRRVAWALRGITGSLTVLVETGSNLSASTIVRSGFSREPHATGVKFNEFIRGAFAAVQMPEYTPHSFRKTLAKHGDEICNSMEQHKARSMNLGHEHLATTVNSYIPVSRERQREVLAGFPSPAHDIPGRPRDFARNTREH